MMKCLSKEGSTMFLLSHIISFFSPVATQRIKENKDPCNQSSSKLKCMDKLPPTEWRTSYQNTMSQAATSTLRNKTAKASRNDIYFTRQCKKSQTSNIHGERKKAQLKHKTMKTTTAAKVKKQAALFPKGKRWNTNAHRQMNRKTKWGVHIQ